MTRPRLLFFEPDYRGHQVDYIGHLCQYAFEQKVQAELHFLVHPSLLERGALLASRWDVPGSTVHLRPLSDAEVASVSRGDQFRRDWNQWSVLRDRARELEPDHVISLKIDHQLLSLGLRRSLPVSSSISGILFRPEMHYRTVREGSPGRRVREAGKRLAHQALLRHKDVRCVFSLDPYFAAFAADRLDDGRKVVALPDPVLQIAPDETGLGAVGLENWGRDRLGFILFGYLSERKGVMRLLDALHHLPPEVGDSISVLLAGAADSAIRDRLATRVSLARSRGRGLEIRLLDEFLPGPTLAALIERCAVVLAPYQHAVGSSGVVLWAAGAGRPVLTQEGGLIGRLVREHGLGLAVDTTDPRAIAAAMLRFVQDPENVRFSDRAARALAQSNTPERFAETLFHHVLGAT